MNYFNYILCISCFLFVGVGLGQEPNGVKPNYVMYSGSVPLLSDEYKDLRWHRFLTGNFEIISINKNDGDRLFAHVEDLKSWIYLRWGFSDHKYNKKCMVICVPNEQVFNKWFKQSDIDPRVAITKDEAGDDREVYAILMYGGDKYLTSRLPEKISSVNCLNYESCFDVKLPKWLRYGMPILNNDLVAIRSMIKGMDESKDYDVRDLFSNSKTSMLIDKDFREQSAMLCLFLKKQQNGYRLFSRQFLPQCIRDPSVESLFIYGWKDVEEFNKSYSKYVRNLIYDVKNDRTPDVGLTWFVPR